MKRASYRAGIAWIADNDSAGDHANPDELAGYISVLLLADLFNRSSEVIAREVVRYRAKHSAHDIVECHHCGAAIGDRCTVPGSKQATHDKPHANRVRDAMFAQGAYTREGTER